MTIRPFFRALIPAGILAALVLFVFSTLQYYGPESAVRRFHEGIKWRDGELLEGVTIAPQNSREAAEVTYLVRVTQQKLVRGDRLRFRNYFQTESGNVVFDVYYMTRGGRFFANAPFVASKTDLGWKVNAHETLSQWNKLFRPRSSMAGDKIARS